MAAGKLATDRGYREVVNKVQCRDFSPPGPHLPGIRDFRLEGRHVDVLVIGAGVIEYAVARELSRWNLKVLLIDAVWGRRHADRYGDEDQGLQAHGKVPTSVHLSGRKDVRPQRKAQCTEDSPKVRGDVYHRLRGKVVGARALQRSLHARDYQVSRATVRAALESLSFEGYLVKKHGIGTFVARLRPSLCFEPLISLSYALEVGGLEPQSVVLASQKIEPDRRLRALMRWKGQDPCFHVRRLRLAENIPIALEDSYFHPAVESYLKNRDLTGSIAKILLSEARVTISRVEQVIVPREPDPEERRFLGLEEGSPVLDLQRWIYVQDSPDPQYYLKFVMRGDLAGVQGIGRFRAK